MGVKVRKIRGKYYLVIDYRGKRKTRVIGRDRKIAEEVRRQVEAKLALGDTGIFDENQDKQKSGEVVPIFSDYAARWLESYAWVELKRSTFRSYEQLRRLHVIPQFGHLKLSDIKRQDIKMFLSKLSRQTKTINQVTSPKFSRDTLRLVVCALRTVLNAAVEDGDLESNPASRVGNWNMKGDHVGREVLRRQIRSSDQLFDSFLRTGKMYQSSANRQVRPQAAIALSKINQQIPNQTLL
jgi:integrase